MTNEEMIERLVEVEARSKSNTHRIDKLEPIVSEIHEMSVAMVTMTSEMKAMNNTIGEVKEKVNGMERKPIEESATVKQTFQKAVISAIGSAFGVGILWLLLQALPHMVG